MSNPGRSSSSAVVRIAVVAIIAIGIVAFFRLHAKPMTEDQVRAMLASRELIGLPVATAAGKLQHNLEPITDGALACDFAQVPGWSAGPVILEVKNGDVTDAYFERDKDH
jgi:hypothetical protein